MAEGSASGKSKLPQDIIADVGVDDLYQFLGVDFQSSEKEINGAYRKKALKYHPDKNPDDPHASELFQKVYKAYQILTDPAAKAAYDKWLKAKQAAKRRHDELNVKRRKLKESLEMRESQSFQAKMDEMAAKDLQREIDRLREDGLQRIKEQEKLLRQQQEKLLTQQHQKHDNEDIMPTLKVSWRAKKTDASNGGYSQEILEDIFSKFGGVDHVLVSKKKKGKAIVSFATSLDAVRVIESGCGLEGNPLKLAWVNGDPSVMGGGTSSVQLHPHIQNSPARSLEEEIDYESSTLKRLRQAQERKRLAEQFM